MGEKINFKNHFYLSSGVLVLRLEGALDGRAKEGLSELYDELEKLDFLHLVMNLTKIKNVERTAHRALVQFQLLARQRPVGRVRIIPPPSPLKDKLMIDGILKREELYKDLKDALESI